MGRVTGSHGYHSSHFPFHRHLYMAVEFSGWAYGLQNRQDSWADNRGRLETARLSVILHETLFTESSTSPLERLNVTSAGQSAELGMWVDRTRRMVDYLDEALAFLGRAGNQFPVLESDVGLVCRLWAVADEHDEILCRALTEFDSALFASPGELDITRGVETRPTPEQESHIIFLCTWSIVRPEQDRVSCVLYAEQLTGSIGLEVRDSGGSGYPLPFPITDSSDLYKTLSDTFFGLAARL